MEGQIQSAPAPTQSQQAVGGGGTNISSNHIILTVLGGIVAGFAVGIGFIMAQKMMKKNIVVQQDMSSMNGINQNMMYPPRYPQGRPPMQRTPQNFNQAGFMRFDGKQDEPKFDIDAWIKSSYIPTNDYSPKEMDTILGKVRD